MKRRMTLGVTAGLLNGDESAEDPIGACGPAGQRFIGSLSAMLPAFVHELQPSRPHPHGEPIGEAQEHEEGAVAT